MPSRRSVRKTDNAIFIPDGRCVNGNPPARRVASTSFPYQLSSRHDRLNVLHSFGRPMTSRIFAIGSVLSYHLDRNAKPRIEFVMRRVAH